MSVRKRVSFTYDSERTNKKILVNWYNNRNICNDNKSVTHGPNLDILRWKMDGKDGDIVLTAAKECLEEMLALVNEAIENG